jgi:adenylate cyclase
MGKEIERKFLVNGDSWRAGAHGKRYRQGYLSTVKERTVRIRVAGDQGFITVKGITIGDSRPEYEYEIPLADANEIIENLCERPFIEKTRYRIPHGDVVFEVDEFEGVNKGLIVAEVELQSEDQKFEKPEWLGDEVSNDPRYFNANLVAKPFTTW